MQLLDRHRLCSRQRVRHFLRQSTTRCDHLVEHVAATRSRDINDRGEGTIKIRQLLAHVSEAGIPATQGFDCGSRVGKLQPRETRTDGETILDDHGGAPQNAVGIDLRKWKSRSVINAAQCSGLLLYVLLMPEGEFRMAGFDDVERDVPSQQAPRQVGR